MMKNRSNISCQGTLPYLNYIKVVNIKTKCYLVTAEEREGGKETYLYSLKKRALCFNLD